MGRREVSTLCTVHWEDREDRDTGSGRGLMNLLVRLGPLRLEGPGAAGGSGCRCGSGRVSAVAELFLSWRDLKKASSPPVGGAAPRAAGRWNDERLTAQLHPE